MDATVKKATHDIPYEKGEPTPWLLLRLLLFSAYTLIW